MPDAQGQLTLEAGRDGLTSQLFGKVSGINRLVFGRASGARLACEPYQARITELSHCFLRRLKDDDEVDGLQRGEHFGAAVDGIDRPALAFQPRRRGVAVEPDHQVRRRHCYGAGAGIISSISIEYHTAGLAARLAL